MKFIERFFGQKPQDNSETPSLATVNRGEVVMRRLSQNIEKAAQRLAESGHEVDLDDLGWEAGRIYQGFLEQDPAELRQLAKKGLEYGIFDEEYSQEILADADFIEEEQKRRKR